jgi:hypothetical protein
MQGGGLYRLVVLTALSDFSIFGRKSLGRRFDSEFLRGRKKETLLTVKRVYSEC